MKDGVGPRTGVAVCLDAGLELDTETLCLTVHDQATAVHVAPRLCESPVALSGFVREHKLTRLVIGACGAGVGPAVERGLRSAGLEPWTWRSFASIGGRRERKPERRCCWRRPPHG